MPRRPRRQLWTEAACYHLINRGHNRETVFATDDDRRYFLTLLARYRQRFHLRLYHYCLMTNHFHIAAQVRACRDLSRCLAGLLRAYVHYFNRSQGFVGHLWQGRFKSPAIEADSYLLSCGRYIERNPLEAGMVELPWEYAWSSCRHYALGEANELLSPNPWYEQMGADAATRQERWRAFLMDGDPKEERIRRQDWLVGEDAFRVATCEERSRPMGRGRGRPLGRGAGTLLSQGEEGVGEK